MTRFWHNLRTHFTGAALLALLTAALVAGFLIEAPRPSGLPAWLFVVSVPAYHALAVCLVALLLAPLALLRVTRWLIGAAVFLWLFYLVADLIVFRAFRVHIDPVILEIVLFDFRGLGAPWPLIALTVAGVLGLAALTWGFARLARHLARPEGRRRTGFVLVAGLALGLFALQSVISIWAHRFDRGEVTTYAVYPPLFFPMTSHRDGERIAAALPGLFPAEMGEVLTDAPGAGRANYPLAAPVCQPATGGAAPSILLILVESWQADTLRPEVMPATAALADSALRFDRHIANGTATVPGVFSLMFGLNPSYFPLFRADAGANTSILTRTLQAAGYRLSVFTSGSLERFALRSLIFPMVPEQDFAFVTRDEDVVARFDAAMAGAVPGQARFDFVFLTASHSPYVYPPEHARFAPVPAVNGSYVLNRDTDPAPYLNRYWNSLSFVDANIARILGALERAGRLENTVIVITGDHAEEFNETGRGFWGHGSNYTRWQNQTPLLIRFPNGERAGRVAATSAHVDLVPTLLGDVLGCTGARADYSNGESLFALPERRALSMSSYASNAFWVDGVVVERATGRRYDWADMGDPKAELDTALMKTVVEAETRFRQ